MSFDIELLSKHLKRTATERPRELLICNLSRGQRLEICGPEIDERPVTLDIGGESSRYLVTLDIGGESTLENRDFVTFSRKNASGASPGASSRGKKLEVCGPCKNR